MLGRNEMCGDLLDGAAQQGAGFGGRAVLPFQHGEHHFAARGFDRHGDQRALLDRRLHMCEGRDGIADALLHQRRDG